MIIEQENSSAKENEISIIELWEVLFKKRYLILLITTLFGIASIIYALAAKELWKPEVVIYPSEADNKENSSLNSAISQFISPTSQDTKTSKYLAILLSRNFLLKFIEDENISKDLFEEEWDAKKSTWKTEDKKFNRDR